MEKTAIITFELVDENAETSKSAIAEEMLKWFKEEAAPAPWVKETKEGVVQEI